MAMEEKMFCPRCGHEQSFDGQSFCSGCGMHLDAVAEMISPSQNVKGIKGWSREDGLKWSALIFIVGTCALTPLAAVLDFDELPAIFAVLGFGGSVTLLAYSLLFLPKNRKSLPTGKSYQLDRSTRGLKGIAGKVSQRVKEKVGGRIHDTADQNETRPVGYIPPVGDWRDIEYPQPPSVTDSTTKLLAEEEERRKSDQ